MKKVSLLFALLIIFSCESPIKKEANPKVVTKKVTVEKKSTIVGNLISLKKEACSGDCPVFEVLVKEDSTLVFKGKKYTALEGIHIIKLTPEVYQNIITAINNTEFGALKAQYFDESSKDFPETIITYGDKSVSVKLWKHAPENLTKVYVLLEDILYENKFLE